jgi:hypothetical protein
VPGQKTSKPRTLDALVGTGIAAVVILAATFGELGPVHRSASSVAYGAMQGPSRLHALKTKPAHAKARCSGAPACAR